MKTPKKYRPLTKEPMTRFVARIVEDEGKAMTADEVMTFCDKRHSKLRKKTRVQFQAHLSDAVRLGHLAKTRIQTSDTQSRVHYHPLGMHPIGDEIPMPLFTKVTVKHEKNALDADNTPDLCDLCNDDDRVGFVDDACTFKVCNRCDTDGADFNPKVWPQNVLDEIKIDRDTGEYILDDGIDLDDLPADPAPRNDPRIPEHLHWGNKPDADWKFTPLRHSDAFIPHSDAFTVDNIIQLRPLFMKHGRLVTSREFRFTARELIDQLHELDVRLYEEVLDTIADGLGINSKDGWFGNDNGDMCIREEVFE